MVWDTALRRKFTNDIFFSTRMKIIGCLTLFVGVIVVTLVIVLENAKKTLMGGMVESLSTAITTGVSDSNILESAASSVQFATYIAVVLVLLFGLFMGLLLSRIALAPTGQAFTMQKRFISGIAHELRTPLSLLRINNELARFSIESDSPYAELFEENIADIDKINEMLNNLLLFDRMVSITSLRFKEVDLPKLMKAISARLASLAEHKNIALKMTDAEIPTICGNVTALEQAFFNILKNAITYTKSGGEVAISYRGVIDDAVTINISDTGVGIPEKDLAHIFEPFYRTEKTGKLSGTGIGLAIVYEIIKIHKGSIEVDSVEGKGTSLTLSLPVSPALSQSQKLTQTSTSKILFNFTNTTKV